MTKARIRGRARAYRLASWYDTLASDIEACISRRLYGTAKERDKQAARAETWREAASELRRVFELPVDGEPLYNEDHPKE